MARSLLRLLAALASASCWALTAQAFLLPPASPSSRAVGRQAPRAAAGGGASPSALAALPPKADYDLELFSPAKVNLFLRIIRRREDGYHELASLFQTVGFGDTLLFKARSPQQRCLT